MKEKVLDQPSKSFIFNRLGVSPSQTSINEEKENRDQSPRSSAFDRFEASSLWTLTFDRLSIAKKRASIFDCLKSDDVEASLEKPIHTKKIRIQWKPRKRKDKGVL